MSDDEPYENTLTLEELRREVRYEWDVKNALVRALRELPEVPPVAVLLYLSRAAKWPEDNSLGKQLQRKVGSAVIPFKSECEGGAGLWTRIRSGLMISQERGE